jgi:hypothetical protein
MVRRNIADQTDTRRIIWTFWIGMRGNGIKALSRSKGMIDIRYDEEESIWII